MGVRQAYYSLEAPKKLPYHVKISVDISLALRLG